MDNKPAWAASAWDPFTNRLDQPRRWKRPRIIFVSSKNDLFHEQVLEEFINRIVGIMASCPQHNFQVLTRQPERMVEYFRAPAHAVEMAAKGLSFPLPNLWLGVSIEDQHTADCRIPLLLQTPAALRYVSAQPLVDPIFLKHEWIITPRSAEENGGTESSATGSPGDVLSLPFAGIPTSRASEKNLELSPPPRLVWCIVGGGSGSGARPLHPTWVRRLRDQCNLAGVAFFFSQWGEYSEDFHRYNSNGKYLPGFCFVSEAGLVSVPSSIKPERDCEGFNPFDPILRGHPGWTCMQRVGRQRAGRLLDGRTWDEMPFKGLHAAQERYG